MKSTTTNRRELMARLVKRLRYTMALGKTGQGISTKQAEMLAMDIIPYLDRQGAMVEISDMELSLFQLKLMEEAWNSGTLESNFRMLKLARENTR